MRCVLTILELNRWGTRFQDWNKTLQIDLLSGSDVVHTAAKQVISRREYT